jgi:hypothetical protein
MAWMNQSVLDTPALQAAADLCEKAREDRANHGRKQTLAAAKPSRLRG